MTYANHFNCFVCSSFTDKPINRVCIAHTIICNLCYRTLLAAKISSLRSAQTADISPLRQCQWIKFQLEYILTLTSMGKTGLPWFEFLIFCACFSPLNRCDVLLSASSVKRWVFFVLLALLLLQLNRILDFSDSVRLRSRTCD